VAAAAALDELYAALPPREKTRANGEVTVSVSHPRDMRDATTELANAYSIVGDSAGRCRFTVLKPELKAPDFSASD
jgi:hypothetical protein